MSKKYQVKVFGQSNCDKCRAMNHKIDELLKKDEYKDFEKQYVDVMSDDGLVTFCDLECLSPQKIPSFVVMELQGKEWTPIKRQDENVTDEICGNLLTYQHVGIQTDYSQNNGKITSKMIEHIFNMVIKDNGK
jgi:hypothetical protein